MNLKFNQRARLVLNIALGVTLLGTICPVAYSADWTATGVGGISGNWSSVSPADPGWSTVAYPNGAGDVAQFTANLGLGTPTTTQDISGGVTVGTINMGNIGSAGWIVANSTTTPIIFNQDGAGAGFATISNSNSDTSTSNSLTVGDGTWAMTLADDLHIINTSASTSTKGAIGLNGPVGGTGNIFLNSSQPVLGSGLGNSTNTGGIRITTGVATASTFVGNVTVEKGLVAIQSPGLLGSVATNTLFLGSSTANSDTVAFFSQKGIDVPNNIVVNSASTGSIALGALSLAASLGGSAYSGTITLNRSLLIASNTVNTFGLTITGKITGVGSLTIGDSSANNIGRAPTIFKNVSNDYAGDTIIAAGTLIASGGSAIPDGPGKGNVVLQNSLATFFALDGDETINGLTGGSLSTVRPGALGVYPNPTAVISSHTLSVGNNDATSTFAGIMRDNGAAALSLIKIGNGTLTLSGANLYSGTTNVNAGTLLVNGSHSPATGNYTVASGATLGGIGSIAPNISINAGGILAPGASIGTLSANNNVTLPGTLKVEFSGGTIDLLAVGGALDITGGTVDFDNIGALTAGPHVFATYGSLVGGAFANIVDLPAGYQISYAYNDGVNSNHIALVVAAHPGDFDGDGDVDGADFVAWQTNFPTASGATLAQGDSDGDGDVDGADFVVWQTNFPFTPGPGASPVPEPATIILALVGGAFALVRRHRRS